MCKYSHFQLTSNQTSGDFLGTPNRFISSFGTGALRNESGSSGIRLPCVSEPLLNKRVPKWFTHFFGEIDLM